MNIFYSIVPLQEMSAREIHQLYKLRVDIFVHDQRTPYAEIDDVDVESATRHVLAWDPKTNPHALLGSARVVPVNDKETKLGRIVVTPARRGTGLAPEIIYQALRFCSQTYPGTDILLDAQAPLVEYYSQFGFEPEGELFDDTGVPHQPMRMQASRLAVEVSQHNYN